jgi:hypothetical protein
MDLGEGHAIERPAQAFAPTTEKPEHALPEGSFFVFLENSWCVMSPDGKAVQYTEWLHKAFSREPDTTKVSTVRLPHPQHFSGDGDCDPRVAVMSIETWLRASGAPRAQWASMTQTFLKGAAARAYSALALPLFYQGKTPGWEEVKELILRFRRQDTPITARMKLAQIRQTGSVADYNRYFDELLMQVGADAPARTDLLAYYFKGLRNPTPLNPAGQKWHSVQDAQLYHSELEMAQMQFEKPSTHTARPPRFNPKHSNPRLNAVQTVQTKKRAFGEGSAGGGRGGYGGRGNDSGRGSDAGRGGRGGRGPKGFQGYGNAGPSSGYGNVGAGSGYGSGYGAGNGEGPSEPGKAHGTNKADFLAGLDGPCPIHGPTHTKIMCKIWENRRGEFMK